MIDLLKNTFKNSKIILIVSVFLIICMSFSYESNSESAIFEKVFATNHELERVNVTMLIKERINGEFLCKKTYFKISYKPYKFY